MTEPTKRNHKEADDLRQVALRGPDDLVMQLCQGIPIMPLLRVNLLLVADLLDIYEEGGVDLAEWTAASKLIRTILNGDAYPRGTSVLRTHHEGAPSSTPPQQSLLVPKG